MAPSRRLSSKQVLVIVELYACQGMSCDELGAAFHASPATIRRAIADFEQAYRMPLLRAPGRRIRHMNELIRRRPNVPLVRLLRDLRRNTLGIPDAESRQMPTPNPAYAQKHVSGELRENASDPFDALLDPSTYRDSG